MLRENEWSQATLAEVLGRPTQLVSEICNDKKRVTADTAKQLEAAFKVPARVWLLLQTERDLEG